MAVYVDAEEVERMLGRMLTEDDDTLADESVGEMIDMVEVKEVAEMVRDRVAMGDKEEAPWAEAGVRLPSRRVPWPVRAADVSILRRRMVSVCGYMRGAVVCEAGLILR